MQQFIKLIVIRFLFYHSFGQVKLWINKHFKEPAHLVSIVVISNEAEANMPVRLLTFAESRHKMGVGGNYRAGDIERNTSCVKRQRRRVRSSVAHWLVWLLICPLSMIKQLCHLIVNCLRGSVLSPHTQPYMYRLQSLCQSRRKNSKSPDCEVPCEQICVCTMRTHVCLPHCPATATHRELV